jgi:hypothetical protein
MRSEDTAVTLVEQSMSGVLPTRDSCMLVDWKRR